MAAARGTVYFEEDYCKGCSLCTDVCTAKIITLDMERVTSKGYHPAIIIDESKCNACANCAVMCPDSAIRVERFDK
ncbi:MAG: 4Fe-4S binding protein [Eubacteriaceae bacterium]|nr:4Fe-4S binding protein [Eubacteriaceae bacterium]